ncbi:hypothetical protein [Aliidiomarina soli]|uniref:Uncharacterized protein n=1 Tax=Aliidiomarina soli TaxID=1928574 RepID=A0A432WE43_9GAMM|nr:hypothetical protein [Aliidiomarina soli]RUO31132.1 hypothetical protein CWE14_11595 [Aliidiomarina soli]
MKAIDFIWPDKWISFNFRVLVVIFAWILWVVVFYLKYFVFHASGVLQFVGIIPILIIWTYLFDKDIPMAPVNIEFNDGNIGIQIVRSVVFWMAVVGFIGILFIGDW